MRNHGPFTVHIDVRCDDDCGFAGIVEAEVDVVPDGYSSTIDVAADPCPSCGHPFDDDQLHDAARAAA